MVEEDPLDVDTHAREILRGDKKVSSREEMVCPRCYEQSIVRAPQASQYNNKRARMLKGTMCGNPDCNKGQLSIEEVEQQYEHFSLFSGGLSDPKTLLKLGSIIGIILIVIAFVAMPSAMLGLVDSLFSGPTETVSGAVVDSEGNPVSNAQIELNGGEYSVKTDSSGEFTIKNVPTGTYKFTADGQRTFEANVQVKESKISITDSFIPKSMYKIDGTSMTIQIPEEKKISEQKDVDGSTSKEIMYLSESNTSELTVEVNRVEDAALTEEKTETIKLNKSQEITTSGKVTDIRVAGNGFVTKESFTKTGETDSKGEVSVNVEGNLEPTNMTISVPESAGELERTLVYDMASGDERTSTLEGSVEEDATVTIRGGNTSAPQTKSGLYDPSSSELTFTVSENDAPSTATLTLTGRTEETQEKTSGTLSGSETSFTVDPSGSLKPSNAKIVFEGGDVSTETVNEETVSASGKNGSTENVVRVAEISDSSGTYVLDYNVTIDRNSEYVAAGYSINGNRSEFTNTSGTVELDVSKGDKIDVWFAADREELQTADYTNTSNIEVQSFELQSTEINSGDDIGIRATVKNTGSSTDTHNIKLFINGTESQDIAVTLDPDEEKTLTFDRETFDTEGVYSIQVNESSVKTVSVDGAELKYGKGSVTGALEKTSDQGEVSVDTNTDGSYDCTVSANGGECELSVPEDGATFDVSQNGVDNTSYTVEYINRSGPEGVKADLNGDGNYDINSTGELTEGETVSKTMSFEEGTHEIDITTENGEEVDYTLEWTESGVINNPKLYVNGTQVISVSESYQGEREFSVSGEAFKEGENSIRLETDDSATHTVEINLTESSDSTFPRIEDENGHTLCESEDLANSPCEISQSNVNHGREDFVFYQGGERANSVSYEISYTSVAVPKNLQLIKGGEVLAEFDKETAAENRLDNSWSDSTTLPDNQIKSGSKLSVTTTTKPSGVSLSGEMQLSYVAEREHPVRPVVVVENPDGSTETYEVPETSLDKNGKLENNATITVPKSALERGNNIIRFKSENSGYYVVEISGSEDSDGSEDS